MVKTRTNTELLDKLIAESGLKKKYLADQLAIHPYSLSRKINNEAEFLGSEITMLCGLLKIASLELKEAVFFAPEVD